MSRKICSTHEDQYYYSRKNVYLYTSVKHMYRDLHELCRSLVSCKELYAEHSDYTEFISIILSIAILIGNTADLLLPLIGKKRSKIYKEEKPETLFTFCVLRSRNRANNTKPDNDNKNICDTLPVHYEALVDRIVEDNISTIVRAQDISDMTNVRDLSTLDNLLYEISKDHTSKCSNEEHISGYCVHGVYTTIQKIIDYYKEEIGSYHRNSIIYNVLTSGNYPITIEELYSIYLTTRMHIKEKLPTTLNSRPLNGNITMGNVYTLAECHISYNIGMIKDLVEFHSHYTCV